MQAPPEVAPRSDREWRAALERVRDDPSLVVPHFQAIVDLNRAWSPASRCSPASASAGVETVAELDRLAGMRIPLARPFADGPRPALVSALSVFPNAGIAQVARRAMTRPRADRFAPVVYCDEQGRYIGLVRIERLIGALAVAGQPPVRP